MHLDLGYDWLLNNFILTNDYAMAWPLPLTDMVAGQPISLRKEYWLGTWMWKRTCKAKQDAIQPNEPNISLNMLKKRLKNIPFI